MSVCERFIIGGFVMGSWRGGGLPLVVAGTIRVLRMKARNNSEKND